MWLTEVSIKRPLLIIMVMLGFITLGAISYTRLGADLYPSINIPYISVVVVYPGAGPTEVEDRVTKPIEDAVAGASGVKNLISYSIDGVSAVVLEFNVGVDPDAAVNDVDRRVKAIRASLPEDVEEPTVMKAEFNALPIVTLSLWGDRPSQELYRLANEHIRPRLETVEGVAAVRVVGGREREIQVKVHESRLRAYGLSIQHVTNALAQSNLSVPGGRIVEGGAERNVRYSSLYQTAEDLQSVILVNLPTGVVRLRDVADVEDGLKEQERINRFNGHDSVGLLITKQSNANTVKVADAIKAAVADLEKTLPQNVHFSVASDSSTYIRSSLDGIQSNLWEAIVLTGLVLLLFLHTARSTVIVLFSIPTSLISTFIVMWVAGFTLNMMSMLALALSIGILVDDSIVVLENIYRHLGLGKTPWTAALDGRSEIGLAAITITLVDVVVYTPMAFMSGLVGQFFRQFGMTVAVATLFSLFVSFTLTPMLASRWLRTADAEEQKGVLGAIARRWEAGYARLLRAYRRALEWSLVHRWVVVVVAVVSFLGAVALVPLDIIGSEFVPTQDQGEFNLMVEMPPGTSLAATNEAVLALEPKVRNLPEVKNCFTSVGISGSGFFVTSESRYARLSIQLVERGHRSRSVQEVAREIESLAATIPDMKTHVQYPAIGEDPRQPFLVYLLGEDQEALRKLGREVTEIVKSIPGTRDVTNSAGVSSPEIRVEADQNRLADLGLTSAQVGLTVRTYLQGAVASHLRPEGQSKVDIRVIASEADRESVDRLESLPVLTSRGAVVSLGSIADVRTVESPIEISRWNRQRCVTVGANVVGRPLGDVVDEFNARAGGLRLPAGYSLRLSGQTQLMEESFDTLVTALALSIVLIYMLLVSLYESLLYPFIIMLALPVSLCGVFGALWLTGRTLNISSLIGIIMLMGLVAKNGILLVDYTNTLRKKGIARDDALLEAGPVRLRPILMTTLAMVAAMMPVVLVMGEGAEIRAPLATAVAGGLITSTVLTLVVVPVVYTLLDDVQTRLGWGWRQERPSDAAPKGV